MDDVVLRAKLNDTTTLYVSPIGPETYAEYVDEDNLGGDAGYFLMRSLTEGESRRFEVLAKAPSFDAASDLFDMIVQAWRPALSAGR
jgi:hypothetical protein